MNSQERPSPTTSTPAEEYARRLQQRQQAVDALEREHVRTGNLRLLVAVVAAVLLWLSLGPGTLPLWTLALPAAAFLALVIRHERTLRARARAQRAVKYYQKAVARLEDRWIGSGEAGDRFADPQHPYEGDLDLFGRGGLFELLSTARTRAGEELLARWLLHPAAPEVVRSRQEAVEELRQRLDLREDFALLGEDIRSGVHPEALMAWAEAAPVLTSGRIWLGGGILSIVMLAAVAAWQAFDLFAVFPAALAAVAAYGWRLRSQVLHVVHGVELAAHDLDLLSAVLLRIEREEFRSPRLKELRAALESTGMPPSRQIARLDRAMELLDSRDNLVMRIIGPPLLYTTHMAFVIERWRMRSGPAVRAWIEATGEIEALCAMSGYAYEHPADPFPELAEDQGALFEAEGLGHPLLAEAKMVRNDVSLDKSQRILIVSGSNMSGKSTLLRSIGVAGIFAMAGLPVRARRLRLSPLAVGASIRITDSLQEGASRFYAEITRLRRIVDIASGPVPLLFLLDELLNGTNSHDRRIGAEGIVRGLYQAEAVGLVTTHDLALTHIAEALAPHAANVHFEDHLENGRIRFDYKMRPGVVQKSNALELMRSVGLDV